MKKESFGLVEGNSYVGMMEIVDSMLKTANLQLVTLSRIGRGLMVACFHGEVGSMSLSLDNARSLASERNGVLRTVLITNPHSTVYSLLMQGPTKANEES